MEVAHADNVLQAHATNVADELIKSYVEGSGLK